MTPQTMIIIFFGIIVLVPLSAMLYSTYEYLKSQRNETFRIIDGKMDGMSLDAIERSKRR